MQLPGCKRAKLKHSGNILSVIIEEDSVFVKAGTYKFEVSDTVIVEEAKIEDGVLEISYDDDTYEIELEVK